MAHPAEDYATQLLDEVRKLRATVSALTAETHWLTIEWQREFPQHVVEPPEPHAGTSDDDQEPASDPGGILGGDHRFLTTILRKLLGRDDGLRTPN